MQTLYSMGVALPPHMRTIHEKQFPRIMITRNTRVTSLAIPIAAALALLPLPALAQTVAPEIVSAWKHDTEDLVAIFRHDGVFYIVDAESGQPGMERGTFQWDETSGAFSANVVVDTNGDAGLSDPNAATSITVSGNTLTYTVAGEGSFPFTRIVNTPSAIVGSWHIPGQDANLTFLADGSYYHSEESDDEPDSTTGIERGTYTWNSGTGALSATPLTDTNGNIGLSDPAPSYNFTISGNIMTIIEGAKTFTARRITPILSPLNTENDFEVDKFANYRQTSASAPTLLAGPPNDDQPFWGEAYIGDTVSGTDGTLTITGQSPRNFVDDFGWGIGTEYTSLAALNAANAFPNGADYLFSRAGGIATLSYPANGTFPPAPVIAGGQYGGTWSNGAYVLGLNQTLIWSAHTAYDPATLATVLSVVEQGTGTEIMYEEVIQGDIVSYDFRGKLTQGKSYDVQLEHVKIAGSTTSGTGPFAGKLGYALYNSNTRFTMVAPDVQSLSVKKRLIRQQQSATALAAAEPTFDATVEGIGINANFPSSSITLAKPGGSSVPLFFDEDHWDAEEVSFASLAALQAAFPDGIYGINIGSDTIPIDMSAINFPNQPLITSSAGTWEDGKLRITASQAAAGFSLSSNISTGNSSVRLSVFDAGFNDIVYRRVETDSVSATIDPGQLAVGVSYTAECEFNELIDYSQVPDKSWGSAVEALGLLSSETFLTIEVIPDPMGTPYTTWQSGFFTPTELADPAISGDTADFDKDNISNLLEYLLGGDPTLPSSGLLPTITKTPGGGNLVFSYKRKLAATGVTQVIEHATTLAPPWTAAAHGVGGVTIITTPVAGDATSEQVTVTIPSASANRFVRLKASR